MLALSFLLPDKVSLDKTTKGGAVRRSVRKFQYMQAVLAAIGLLLASHRPLPGQSSTLGTILEGKLLISLLDRSPLVLQTTDLYRLPQATVKVHDLNKRHAVYSGVLIKDLLEHLGFEVNTNHCRANLARVVVVESFEEGPVVFSVAELDVRLTDKRILLADHKDRRPLVAPEGPLRLIVPDEKSPARWVKHVWAIYVADVAGSPAGKSTRQNLGDVVVQHEGHYNH